MAESGEKRTGSWIPPPGRVSGVGVVVLGISVGYLGWAGWRGVRFFAALPGPVILFFAGLWYALWSFAW